VRLLTNTEPTKRMKTSDLKAILRKHPKCHLTFILPSGKSIPIHAHITEVGRVDKTFLDCGATIRKISYLSLQSWVADDTDHRLPAETLADIIDRAAPILGNDDLDVEIEYEDGFITQLPVESAKQQGDLLVFTLSTKHTDCLAKEICLPPPKDDESSSCCSSTGCC
jgi:hypothetical protein